MERIHRLRETLRETNSQVTQSEQPHFFAATPLEARNGRPGDDDKIRRARHCTDCELLTVFCKRSENASCLAKERTEQFWACGLTNEFEKEVVKGPHTLTFIFSLFSLGGHVAPNIHVSAVLEHYDVMSCLVSFYGTAVSHSESIRLYPSCTQAALQCLNSL